jgi:hypothetical protein
MVPLNYPSKRAHQDEMRCNPILGQGVSRPYQVPHDPNHHSNSVKRQRISAAPVLGLFDSHKGRESPFEVYSLPQNATWKSEPDRFPTAPRGIPACVMEASSSATNKPSNSLEAQRLAEPLDLTDSHIGSGQFWNPPFKETSPTTESHTLGSSSSTGERAEWEVDPDPTLDTYSYAQISTARTEPDISHVTGNSDHLGQSGAWDNWLESPSNPTSKNVLYHQVPTNNRIPEIYVEPWDTSCEYLKPSLNLDKSN